MNALDLGIMVLMTLCAGLFSFVLMYRWQKRTWAKWSSKFVKFCHFGKSMPFLIFADGRNEIHSEGIYFWDLALCDRLEEKTPFGQGVKVIIVDKDGAPAKGFNDGVFFTVGAFISLTAQIPHAAFREDY
jgi:hypothetical protein